MIDNEFILQDRIQKIRQIITQYGIENFAISFSGGKDSTVLHHLIDMALPKNNIPRVYCNTGIELKMIQDFVTELWCNDDRIVTIRPKRNIRETLNEYGYPFKSKEHAAVLEHYQKVHDIESSKWVYKYLNKGNSFACPEKLKYQFTPEFNIKISAQCCNKLKEEPLYDWLKNNNKKYWILGIMGDEGGRRMSAKCLRFSGKKLKTFNPLVAVDKKWEDWFINEYDIKICNIYKPPFNFDRTGCKGCPFNPHLQKDLDTLETFFPAERKQCEIIWKPIYDEYRRIGYRLKGGEENEN